MKATQVGPWMEKLRERAQYITRMRRTGIAGRIALVEIGELSPEMTCSEAYGDMSKCPDYKPRKPAGCRRCLRLQPKWSPE